MRIIVKLFAVARQLAETDAITVELPDGANVADLRAALPEQYPQLKGIVSQLKFAVNADYAADDCVLNEDQEIACIPPVSGG